MSTEFREILDRIQHLPESAQLELRSELARIEEQEWSLLLQRARQDAKNRGIDDATIVRTIESLRYDNDGAAGIPNPGA